MVAADNHTAPMIVLHKKGSHRNSELLEERVKELVITFKKKIHSQAEKGLPFIEEDGKVFKTDEEIEDWFKEIKEELDWQRSLSGDGCYINPKDGRIC